MDTYWAWEYGTGDKKNVIELVRAADAQRALDAEREKVKELREWRGKVTVALLRPGGAFYEDVPKHVKAMAEELATLQAQLRQVEGERDAHAQDVDDLIDCCINDVLVTHATPGGKPHDPDPQIRPLRDKIAGSLVELQTLRQLVEALPVVDGRMDVECGACYYIRSFVAGQYGIVCGLITEQSTAMAIKALLEYRATLAAGQVSTSIIGKQVPPSQWDKNAGVRGDIS